MPYIIQDDRKRYNELVAQLIAKLSEIPEEDRDGHLNYCVTLMLKRLYSPPKYKRYNKAIGVLECIKQEFYRKVVAPYEDLKEQESGPVE